MKALSVKTLVLLVSLVVFLFTSAAHEPHHEQSASVDCDVCLVFGGVAPGTASTGEQPAVVGAAAPVFQPVFGWVSASELIPPSRAPPAFAPLNSFI